MWQRRWPSMHKPPSIHFSLIFFAPIFQLFNKLAQPLRAFPACSFDSYCLVSFYSTAVLALQHIMIFRVCISIGTDASSKRKKTPQTFNLTRIMCPCDTITHWCCCSCWCCYWSIEDTRSRIRIFSWLKIIRRAISCSKHHRKRRSNIWICFVWVSCSIR